MKIPGNNRVVITGFEVATALGYGFEKTWEQAIQSKSGLKEISKFDVGDYPSTIVGEVPDLDFKQYGFFKPRELKKWFSQFIPLATILSYDALNHAGVQIKDKDSYRSGILVGTALGGLDGYGSNLESMLKGGYNKVHPFLLPNVCSNLACGKASILLNLKGPQYAIGSACATGNHCIGEAARIIQRGDADLMVAGGVEMPLLEPIIYGFGNMNALYKNKESDRAFNNPHKASRPYSIDRNGFILAEGGGIMVLTSLDYAQKNDLTMYGEIIGVGMNGDANHFTMPSLTPIVKCIESAIEDAGINKQDIEYINGHGTSTKVGDKVEISALKIVFGDQLMDIPISSNKSQIGHSLGASGAIESILLSRAE